MGHHLRCRRAGLLRLAPDPPRGPLQMTPVRRRHVRRVGAVAAPVAARVAGHAPTAEEELDHRSYEGTRASVPTLARLRPTARIRPPITTRPTPRPGSAEAAPVPGTGTEETVHAPAGGVMWLSSRVSAPFRARGRPLRILAPVTMVILVSAIRRNLGSASVKLRHYQLTQSVDT